MRTLMFESTVVKALLLCIRRYVNSRQKQKHACILQQQQQRKLQARMLWRSLKLRKLSLRFVVPGLAQVMANCRRHGSGTGQVARHDL
jgi:uncharacterized membrane protein YcgQ (UPF0703/DUF1980 family)